MERCPNCGAPARPNANFCTTCGVRLPDDLGSSPSATNQTATAEPSAPTSDNGWPVVAARTEGEPDDESTGAASNPASEAGSETAVVIAAETESAASLESAAPGRDEEAVAAAPAAARPVDQALSLLDQLRALLPAVMTESSASTAAPNPDLADALAAALADDDEELSGLREAMERARERPKDIDTVLDLAGRVDAVIALLDAHDRLRAAAESTVAQLRGD
jgi:zinc-ribbon domain